MTDRGPEQPEDPEEVDRRFREIVAGLAPQTPPGMATDHRSYEPQEEEDHFVPPRPDPLPAGDLHFWAILVGLVVGPLVVFLSAIVPVLDREWTFVGAAMTIVGFVLLVLRRPRHRRDDDWGARV